MSNTDGDAPDTAHQFPTDQFQEWKQEKIRAHEPSGHAYVVFEHRIDESGTRFTYRIECGGYEETFPHWKLDDESVEIYSIEDERYVEGPPTTS